MSRGVGPSGAGPRVLAVCGLRREAEIAASDTVLAVPGGGDAARLTARLRAIDAGGLCGVVSFGLAGALEPGLKVGTFLLPEEVVDEEGRVFAVDPEWRAALSARLPEAVGGRLAASATVVASAEAKRALRRRAGARSVDMESGTAALEAARRGLPFAVVRVVSDAAETALPSSAVAGMGPGGEVAVGRVILALARRPWELFALVRTGRDAERAFGALLGGRGRLGPALGLADV